LNPVLIIAMIENFLKTSVVIFFILLPYFPYAQLCQGSLGDPIVNIDFGSGPGTHGNALPAGVTNCTYSLQDLNIP
jgi:hypothetical protein